MDCFQLQLPNLLRPLWNFFTKQDSHSIHQGKYKEEGSESALLNGMVAYSSHTRMPNDEYSGSAAVEEHQGLDVNEGNQDGKLSGTVPATPKVQTITQNTEARRLLRRKLKIFTPFPRLVAELRIKIWKLNLPEPRSLTPHPDYVSDDTHGPSAVSPLFDACFESNEVISKIYPLCFTDQLLGNGIRFSPVRDTIVFPDYSTMRDFYPHTCFGHATLLPSEKQAFILVKHLVVRYDFLMGVVLPFVERFESLETLEVEGQCAWDPTSRPPAIDEKTFMERLRSAARRRGGEDCVPIVTFRITG
ncbi:hypothetical protein ACEPPN_015961 [Leptodophora sp. 'Broadleaf-Isolate-01']